MMAEDAALALVGVSRRYHEGTKPLVILDGADFTLHRGDYQKALKLLRDQVQPHIQCREVSGDDRIAKVSAVGVGMRSHAGIAAKMFRALAEEGINIQMISTSEIKISIVIEEKYLELAVRVLHKASELEQG